MEKKNNNGVIIALLVIIIIILGVICYLFATDTISFDSKTNTTSSENTITTTDTNNNQTSKEDEINQEKLLETIDDDLLILFMWSNPNRTINDLDNQSKLYMALSKLKDSYNMYQSEVSLNMTDFSKKALKEAFDSTCLSYLDYDDEDIAEFEYDSENERYVNTNLMPKIGYKYMTPSAKKVVKYENKDNIYTISLKYLFPDNQEGPEYYYGDLSFKNKIVKTYDDNITYIDAQKYLDDNYDSIKDKLATYNYTFTFENNKLLLTDFSIN